MSRILEAWDDVFNSNGEPNLITSDLLMDMLRKAAEESRSSIAATRKSFAIWELGNYRKLVSFVFDLVSSLNIDDPFVRYNTCDLYEEFLELHIDYIKGHLPPKRDLSDESALWISIKEQSLLRLITCVMLSAKVSSSFSIKTINEYINLIKEFGHEYSKVTIVKSELRVLKTVNYKVDQCPLFSVCPLLILTLVYNEPSINGKLLYSILHKTMDYYYLAKADIMTKLFDDLKETREIDYEEFKRFIADSMLISCAIVAVTPMLVDEQSGPQVLKELVYITCYAQRDIEIIRDVILKGILGGLKT